MSGTKQEWHHWMRSWIKVFANTVNIYVLRIFFGGVYGKTVLAPLSLLIYYGFLCVYVKARMRKRKEFHARQYILKMETLLRFVLLFFLEQNIFHFSFFYRYLRLYVFRYIVT